MKPHVCIMELSGCIPVLRDRDVCGRFMAGTALDGDVQLVQGELCTKVPARDIVLAGCGESLLGAIRRIPDWLASTLPWPDSVLPFLSRGDHAGAADHLGNRSLGGYAAPADLGAAGVYWKALLKDERKGIDCLLEAESVLRSGADATTLAFLSRAWMHLYHDHESAARCLVHADEAGRQSDRRASLALARAWRLLPGGACHARRHLADAMKHDDPGASRSLFTVASAWLALLGDRDVAFACAQMATANDHESVWEAVLFWRVVAGDAAQAGECLHRSDWIDNARGRLGVARAIMLLHPADDPEMHNWARNSVLRYARSARRTECLAWAAATYAQLFGDGAEDILTNGASRAGETCEVAHLANAWMEQVHLGLEERRSGCLRLLRLAEERADNPLDLLICAWEWKRLLGDTAGTERCLLSGMEYPLDSEDRTLFADAWHKVGHPEMARRLQED